MRIFKLARVFSLLFIYLIYGSFLIFRHRKSKWVMTRRLSLAVQSFSRKFCQIMRIQVHLQGQLLQKEGLLYVSNHLSYVDIFVMSSVHPTCFVTSMEIKETPVLGFLCTMAGCLFVERRNKKNLEREIEELTQALSNDLSITVFPEATSTNGESVLMFRRALFNSALFAQRPIQPSLIRYRSINDEPVSTQNRDLVCWYGDMAFLPHFWSLAGCKKILVDFHMLEPLVPQPGDDPTDLANESHRRVTSIFKPYSDPNFKMQRDKECLQESIGGSKRHLTRDHLVKG